jgi:endogenous inhibitor of DNA gyrase (YacG/DUF329 family)
MPQSDVNIDRSRNKGMLIYFAVLAIGGLVVVILTVMRDWGFGGWFGGVLLLFTAVASVGSMAKTGGAGLATCPRCGHANPVLHVTMHRYLCCAGCQTWLEGSTTSNVVPDDHVASYPVFDLELPEPIMWPEGCPVCAGPVTRTHEIEGTDVVGDVFAMVAPVAIQKVIKLQAPCCEQHDDGVALRREGGQGVISFRSMSYWRRFMAANRLQPRGQRAQPEQGA